MLTYFFGIFHIPSLDSFSFPLACNFQWRSRNQNIFFVLFLLICCLGFSNIIPKCREINEETPNFHKMTTPEGAASVPTSKGSQERRKPIPDDFLFGKMIGEGSFSCVFLAKDIRSSKEVAIKVRHCHIFLHEMWKNTN